MYVIVIILISAGHHKIASDQTLYPNSASCEASRIALARDLVRMKPTPDAAIFTKCTWMSFADQPKEKL